MYFLTPLHAMLEEGLLEKTGRAYLIVIGTGQKPCVAFSF